MRCFNKLRELCRVMALASLNNFSNSVRKLDRNNQITVYVCHIDSREKSVGGLVYYTTEQREL